MITTWFATFLCIPYLYSPVGETYKRVANQLSFINEKQVSKIGGLETFHNKLKSLGTAKGLFQFQPTTQRLLKVDGNIHTLDTQAKLMVKYLDIIHGKLQRIYSSSTKINIVDYYIVHHLGEGLGLKLLKNSCATNIDLIIPEYIQIVNPKLYKGIGTICDFKRRLNGLLDVSEYKFEKQYAYISNNRCK